MQRPEAVEFQHRPGRMDTAQPAEPADSGKIRQTVRGGNFRWMRSKFSTS